MHTGTILILFSVILANCIVMNDTGRKRVLNHTGMIGDICWDGMVLSAVYYEHHGQSLRLDEWAGYPVIQPEQSDTAVSFACMHSTHSLDQSISQPVHRVAGHIRPNN